MMNDNNTGGLGYDPSDQASFPYQKQDPPFGADDLKLDPVSLDSAPDLDVFNFLVALVNPEAQKYDPTSPYRMLDMGLRLFVKLTRDPAFNDLAYPDLFAAALDTAFIWEDG